MNWFCCTYQETGTCSKLVLGASQNQWDLNQDSAVKQGLFEEKLCIVSSTCSFVPSKLFSHLSVRDCRRIASWETVVKVYMPLTHQKTNRTQEALELRWVWPWMFVIISVFASFSSVLVCFVFAEHSNVFLGLSAFLASDSLRSAAPPWLFSGYALFPDGWAEVIYSSFRAEYVTSNGTTIIEWYELVHRLLLLNSWYTESHRALGQAHRLTVPTTAGRSVLFKWGCGIGLWSRSG